MRRPRCGREPARLRVADQPARAAPGDAADLRQLGGLARTGLAADDHDRVFAIAARSPRAFARPAATRGTSGASQDATANYNGRMTHLRLPEPQQFVAWLRDVAPYIHAFRGKTIVVAFPANWCSRVACALVQDLSLLHSMGMRLVLVYGSRPQIDEQMQLRGVEPLPQRAADHRPGGAGVRQGGLRRAAPGYRGRLLAGASEHADGALDRPRGLGQLRDRAAGGHRRRRRLPAHRPGAQGGRAARSALLDSGAIVLLSPLGFSPTGEAFNLSMEDVAAGHRHRAGRRQAGLRDRDPGVLTRRQVIGEISEGRRASCSRRATCPRRPRSTCATR